ncbi:hypothetical protein JZU51_00315 [bacterium]|nr:hypothetical protein [bacterium]
MGQINQATAGLHGVTAQANAASRASAGLSSTLKGFAATAAGAFSVVAIEQFVSASIDAYEQSAKAQAKVAQATSKRHRWQLLIWPPYLMVI